MKLSYSVAAVVQTDLMRETGGATLRLHYIVKKFRNIVDVFACFADVFAMLGQNAGMVFFDESHTACRRSYDIGIVFEQLLEALG